MNFPGASGLKYVTVFAAGACVASGLYGLLNLPDSASQDKSITPPTRGPESYFRYGYPEKSATFHRYMDHSLVYDRSRKIPMWVSETISRSNIAGGGTGNRKQCAFKPDPSIPSHFSASNSDYRNSGWSRGHMAPAGNMKHSQKAMEDTFYLTNIVPQNVDNNSGYWNRLEMFCRSLTKIFEEIHVISGPLFLPQQDPHSGKHYVKYEVIGDNNVAVPTHLFKIVLAENRNAEPSIAVFVVPNKDIKETPLVSFLISLEQLEDYIGWRFFPRLDRAKLQELCSGERCKLVSQEKIDVMILSKRLQYAKTVEELEQVWKESKVQDQTVVDTYNKRRNDLESE